MGNNCDCLSKSETKTEKQGRIIAKNGVKFDKNNKVVVPKLDLS